MELRELFEKRHKCYMFLDTVSSVFITVLASDRAATQQPLMMRLQLATPAHA